MQFILINSLEILNAIDVSIITALYFLQPQPASNRCSQEQYKKDKNPFAIETLEIITINADSSNRE